MKSAAAGFPTDGATGQPVRAATAESNDTQSPTATQSAYVCSVCDEQACVCWAYDENAEIRSAYQVEKDRRESSTVVCECGDLEKEHGSTSRACLKMKGGRFDGSSDQRRCRCKRFTPKRESQSETPPDTLANDLLHSLVRAQGKKIMEQGAAIVELERKVRDLAHMVGP